MWTTPLPTPIPDTTFSTLPGSAGLTAALHKQLKSIEIQRCTTHKLRNFPAKAPVRMRAELAEDYRRTIDAEDVETVGKQRAKFRKKWRLKCAAVADSLKEAGDDLFTLTKFPSSQWKALWTTNAVERINEEFRRRTKIQASLSSKQAVLLLMYSLLRSGHIRLDRMVGWKGLPSSGRVAAGHEAASRRTARRSPPQRCLPLPALRKSLGGQL